MGASGRSGSATNSATNTACGYAEHPGPAGPNEFRLFGPENLPGEAPYLDAPLKAPIERLRR